MVQVIGYAAKKAKASLTPFYFERRDLLDHDVMIDIQYCGICHTDIHQVKNEWGRFNNFRQFVYLLFIAKVIASSRYRK